MAHFRKKDVHPAANGFKSRNGSESSMTDDDIPKVGKKGRKEGPMIKVKSWVRTDVGDSSAPGAEPVAIAPRFSHPGRNLARSQSGKGFMSTSKLPTAQIMKTNLSLDSLVVERMTDIRVDAREVQTVSEKTIDIRVDAGGLQTVSVQAEVVVAEITETIEPEKTEAEPVEQEIRKEGRVETEAPILTETNSSLSLESFTSEFLGRPSSVPRRLADAPPIAPRQAVGYTPLIDTMFTDPILVPIAIQPDRLAVDRHYESDSEKDKKVRWKNKRGNLPQHIQTSGLHMRHSESTNSFSSDATSVSTPSHDGENLPSAYSPSHTHCAAPPRPLAGLHKSLASFGSSVFSSRSNASLPLRISNSVTSLPNADTPNNLESGSPRSTTSSITQPSPRPSSAHLPRTTSETGGSSDFLTRYMVRSSSRLRNDAVPPSDTPKTLAHSADDISLPPRPTTTPSSPTTTFPLQNLDSNSSPNTYSLPANLHHLHTTDLNSKRAYSTDFPRRIPSPSGTGTTTPTLPHHVIETTTIYARHDKPSTLVSTLGHPEESHGRVNQYHILRPIGVGAYGRVVLCRNELDGRYYACKIISKSRLRKKFRWSGCRRGAGGGGGAEEGGKEYLAAIKREVAILKKLSSHPNINKLVEVLDDGKEDNLYMSKFLPFV
ncbi:hypothetical protein HDV00_005243 [Rhizophlyctis rosea]|nr:hypothetical protein HDV00_005243 [Rhizophlyctis rosea]